MFSTVRVRDWWILGLFADASSVGGIGATRRPRTAAARANNAIAPRGRSMLRCGECGENPQKSFFSLVGGAISLL
jgi:hypothetical protein